MNWKDLTIRLRALVYRRQHEEDLQDELSSHIEFETRKNLAKGMEIAEARRQALIQFGGLPRVTEECRDARGTNWITTAFKDAAYALRGFRRSPLFVTTAVATIALGLGIDTALFTIFNAYYFAPVNVRDPYSLYAIGRTGGERDPQRNRAGGARGYSWEEYQEFLAQNPAFSEAFGYRDSEVRMNDRRAFGLLVTGEYFRALGGSPVLGRTPEDASRTRSEPVVVLSFSAWQNRFGGDPNIVGKRILLHGYPFEVTGVAQSGFRGLRARPVDFWAPVTAAAKLDDGPSGSRPLSIVARLKPEYGVAQARRA